MPEQDDDREHNAAPGESEEPDPASGWGALSATLDRIYAGQEPLHMGTILRWRLGGPDPLDGMSAYLHPDGHWHYVGFGLTELYDKESDDPEWSGWGFELTFRLRHPGAEPPQPWRWADPPPEAAQPPHWPFVLLQKVARYVWQESAVIQPGDYLEGAPAEATGLAGFLAVEDPTLGTVDTANGKMRFVQLVGIDAATLARAKRSPEETGTVLAALAVTSPLLVTELAPA